MQAPANIQLAPVASPAAMMPGSYAEKPESRIHIGRVEVQVNNRPPAGPPPKAKAAGSSAANPLSSRFLERFLLRY
jgi:hypothetical protein